MGGVPGWLAVDEGELLFALARNCTGKGVIVEIGSWKGKSTIWLAKGSKSGNRVKVYAIDPHQGTPNRQGEPSTFPEFEKNIRDAGVADIVMPIVKISEDAAREFDYPVEVIFIDGNHEYESVKRDFELWFPKLIDGGVIAFHDTTKWAGPRRLVSEKIYKSRNFSDVSLIYSITAARKTTQNSIGQRLRSLVMQAIWRCACSFPVLGHATYFFLNGVRPSQIHTPLSRTS